MAQKRMGMHTVKLSNPPSIISTYSIVGPKEGEGPLGKYFDSILEDEFWGEKTWEKSETKIQRECVTNCINKVKLSFDDIHRRKSNKVEILLNIFLVFYNSST